MQPVPTTIGCRLPTAAEDRQAAFSNESGLPARADKPVLVHFRRPSRWMVSR